MQNLKRSICRVFQLVDKCRLLHSVIPSHAREEATCVAPQVIAESFACVLILRYGMCNDILQIYDVLWIYLASICEEVEPSQDQYCPIPFLHLRIQDCNQTTLNIRLHR